MNVKHKKNAGSRMKVKQHCHLVAKVKKHTPSTLKTVLTIGRLAAQYRQPPVQEISTKRRGESRGVKKKKKEN